MSGTPVIRADNLMVRFGGLLAVAGVSLALGSRETCCIVGPNGAGKSTFFNMLTGTVRPTSGHIFVEDRELTGMAVRHFARHGIARKFQAPSVFPTLTVFDNLEVAQRNRGPANRRRQALHDILDLLRLADFAERRAGDLAHGEKQWLEIGMALATEPKILLLDEPTAGMGPEETQRTVELLRGLAERAAVAVIEHDMEFVRALAAPTLVMHQGRIIASGSFEAVANDPTVRDVYLGRQ
jgi:ABC-type uncharacterized transport system ATPase subunit